MLRAHGRVIDKTRHEWSEDGSTHTMYLTLDQVKWEYDSNGDGTVSLAIDFPRDLSFAVWTRFDPALVQDVMHMAATGETSERLEEVRKALGIVDDPSDDH